ncbi:MAG: PEP-CTERM sorting domain-containing protein [Nitrosospira sp.]|nr:PEP-CTERM sorting domain-containing protein [Nitrosospira sp.]
MQKFRKRFALAAIGSLFALAPAVHAAPNTFDGNDFTVSYGVSFTGPDTFIPGPQENVTGNATGVEIADMAGWKIDTMGDSLMLSWNRAADFMNAGTPAFIGFKISDTSSQLSDILDVSVMNTTYNSSATSGNLVEGFMPSQVTSDANNIYVNLNTAMWHQTPMASMGDPTRDLIALSVDFAAPIPEPETYAMLLAGLGLMGTVVRRRKAADKAA